jgi:hypothetical protein
VTYSMDMDGFVVLSKYDTDLLTLCNIYMSLSL